MARAEIQRDRIEVSTEWNERELVKRIPGSRWDVQNKVWYLPLSWTACITLRGVFGADLQIGDKLSRWAWGHKDHIDTLMNWRTLTEPLPGWATAPGLYPFQKVGANFMRLAQEALLGDEMGTGKTIQILEAISQVADSLPALVICPNSVKQNWAKEIEKWTDFHPYVVTGGAVGRDKIIKTAARDVPEATIIIVNYEALRTLTRLAPYGSLSLRRCRQCDKSKGEETLKPSQCQVHPKILNTIPFRTVVIDEAHRIKEPKSQQTRAVWAVAHGTNVRYRWALTGTPLANHPGDLWSILHAISPQDFPTKTHFVDRYCLQSWNPFGGLDIVGINPATRDEFFKLLDPRFRRMPKDLVLSQLPPKVRSTRWVEMGTAQRKMYQQLEDGLIAWTDTGALVAPNALIARMRQMQFSSSNVVIENDQVRMVEPSPKLDELENILEEMPDKPLVVCAESRQLIEMAAVRLDKLKIPYGMITGAVDEYTRSRALADFQSGLLRVLLFTVKAGGVGLTMTAADTIVFLQRSWSMIDNKQAEDRVHRIGSERHESIHVIDIVTRDTVEENQIERLTEKFMRLQEIARDRLLTNDIWQKALDEEEERILNSEL